MRTAVEKSKVSASLSVKVSASLNTRLTEQNWTTRDGDVNNHIAERHQLTNRRIDWDSDLLND